MSKKLQLSIPTPCHEDWENMKPSERGRFCNSCQKQVVDFSIMSDRQVAEFFKKPSTGSVCGRFMTEQLEREIEIPKKRIPWLKYFFKFVIPAFLVSIKTSALKAQGTVSIITASKDTAKKEAVFADHRITLGILKRQICTKPLMGDTINTSVTNSIEFPKSEISKKVNEERNKIIVGKVTDENGDVLPGASIIVKGTSNGVSADNNGQFQIPAKTGDVLVVAGAGLGHTEYTVGISNFISIKVERLKKGFVFCTINYKINSKKEIIDTPLRRQILIDTSLKTFKIFPNPVRSGTTLNIEFKQTEEGYYIFQLLNQSRQSVHQQEIWIDTEARVYSLDIPNLPSGSYFLVLTCKQTGVGQGSKLIIQ